MQLWIILLWMICDLYMVFLYLYPLYEMNGDISGRKKKELIILTVIYVLVRPLSILFCSQKEISSSSVLCTMTVMICVIIRTVLLCAYIHRNMHAGVNLSVFSVIVTHMCMLACCACSEWFHVNVMNSVPLMHAEAGSASVSFSLDTMIVKLVLMGGAVRIIRRTLKSSRKLDDASFGKLGMLALVELFVMISLRGSYVFQLHNTFGKEGAISYMRIVSDSTIQDMTVLSVMILLPLSMLLILYQMMHVFYEKQSRIQAEKLNRMEEEQLRLLSAVQSSRLQEKHAIAEHLNVIRMFLEKEDRAAAQLYIQKTAGIMDEPVPVYCGNPYLNTVICCRMKSDPDIVFDVRCAIGEECGADSNDLGILLLNLLDIRISEIRNHGYEKKITLRIRKRENMITMYADSQISDSHLRDCQLEYSVIENILHRYHGEIYHGLENETDTAVMLRTEETV